MKETPVRYGHAPWLNDPYDTMVFAVRNSVWWIVGSNGNLAGIPQLFLLLSIFASPFFVLPFAVETFCRGTTSPEPAAPEMTSVVAWAGHHERYDAY
jgi:hypothetical protein